MSAQEKLIQAAAALGIQTEDLSLAWNQAAVRFRRGSLHEVILDGNGFGATPLLASTIGSDLPILRHYLATLSIPFPNDVVFKLEEEHTSKGQVEKLMNAFWVDGKHYVCRPAYDHSGVGVASNLHRLHDLELHLDTYADEFATWIVEEQFDGEDLQLLAIGGRLVAGILRSALKLQGDGKHTLEELIDEHNKTASHASCVEIDAETRQLLRDQAIFLSEIVPAGQWVQLKNPGTAAGGATDVTARLHARYADWVRKISAETGLAHFTLHIRSTSIESDPTNTAVVISVDARPEWLPFQNAQGNTQDFATLLLRDIFRLD